MPVFRAPKLQNWVSELYHGESEEYLFIINSLFLLQCLLYCVAKSRKFALGYFNGHSTGAMVWGAIVGMVGAQLIGILLYSKILLGKPWMRGTFPGKTVEQIDAIQKQTFHISMVVCLLSQLALVLSVHYILGPYLGIKTVQMAVKVGMSLTGVAMLVDVPHCMFSQRAAASFIIDHLYNGLVLVTACVSFVYFG